MSGPERIWAARGLYTERKDNRWPEPVEYVRRDPAVLAALPEVQALVDAETERCAKVADARIGVCNALRAMPVWNKEAERMAQCAEDEARIIAAAIREGRT